MSAVPKYVPRITKPTSHINTGLRQPVIDELDRRAAAAGVSRARYLGRLIRTRVDELDAVAARAKPVRDGNGPYITVAATVGAEVHVQVRDAAKAHGVTAARIIGVIADDALADDLRRSK